MLLYSAMDRISVPIVSRMHTEKNLVKSKQVLSFGTIKSRRLSKQKTDRNSWQKNGSSDCVALKDQNITRMINKRLT